MIIKNQKVLIKWSPLYKKYFEKKGYIYTGKNTLLEVNINDLPEGSTAKIDCICNYCGIKIKIMLKKALKDEDHCCLDCTPKKIKKNNFRKYGVESIAQLKSVKDKKKKTNLERYGCTCSINNKDIKDRIKKTNLEKYGVEYYIETEEYKEKTKATNLKKYGVEYSFQAEEVKEKIKKTNIERYGVECTLQSEEVKEKIKKTNLEKYGVDNPWKAEEVKKKIRESLHKNETAPSSYNQRYINELLNGTLNYPVGFYSLDIAFLDSKLYIEYDGSGHDLNVKRGGISEKDFKRKEVCRKLYLQKKGWKLIRIISRKDKLFEDKNIKILYKIAYKYLIETKHTWVEIDIDKNEYRCSEYNKCIDDLLI